MSTSAVSFIRRSDSRVPSVRVRLMRVVVFPIYSSSHRPVAVSYLRQGQYFPFGKKPQDLMLGPVNTKLQVVCLSGISNLCCHAASLRKTFPTRYQVVVCGWPTAFGLQCSKYPFHRMIEVNAQG